MPKAEIELLFYQPSFQYRPDLTMASDARVNLRLPTHLLSQVKAEAIKSGMPYQRLIREFLEHGLEARLKAKPAARKKAS